LRDKIEKSKSREEFGLLDQEYALPT